MIVLDRDVPTVHGAGITSSESLTRILMLTASGTAEVRGQGLGTGADDYLSQPFDFGGLVARIRALGRRAHRPLPPVLRRKGSSWTLHAVWQLETGGASI